MSKEGQRLNLKAGRVVAPEDDGRLGVVIQGLGENVEHFDRSEFTRNTQYITVRAISVALAGSSPKRLK